MNLGDVPDRVVEIEERELVYILSCAMFHGSCLPYGMVPPKVFRLLSREGEGFLAGLRAEREGGLNSDEGDG